MLGCGSTSSQKGESSATSSKFLTIQKGPALNVPIAINQKFSIIFSSDIDPATVNSSSVYIEEVDNSYSAPANGTTTTSGTTHVYYNPVGASLGVKSNKVTITPYKYFTPDFEHRLVVTTGVKDKNGKSLAQDYVYGFTTQNDSVDYSAFSPRSIKPSGNTTLVNTDIVLDFNKTLSSEPEYDGKKYFTVTDANGTEIAGKTEVFNGSLKFIPNTLLPYGADINVTFNSTINDIYGGNAYNNIYSWSFKTRDLNSSPQSSKGFKSLNSISVGKTAYLVRTIKNTTTATNSTSTIAVARDGGIDIYKVKYPTPQSKPTFEYVSSYALSSQVNAMVSFSDKYLLVGTISQGVKVLDTTTNPITDVGDYNTTASIYGVKVGVNSDGFTDKAYAVGPTFGLQVYDINSSSGLLSATFSQPPSVVGEALDVVDAYDSNISRHIYVADYKGNLVTLDENATFLAFRNTYSPTKKIIVQKDYNGNDLYLNVLSSFGVNRKMDFSAALGGYFDLSKYVDLTKSVNDIVGHTFKSISYAYCTVGSDGISISDESSIEQLISTNGDAVSLDFVKSNDYTSFFVTLNSDGLLQIFNAHYDDANPSFGYQNPTDNSTGVAINSTIEFSFMDDYLDEATINVNSFSISDISTSSAVSFSMSKNVEGIFVLTPTNNLALDHNYSVKISPTISDMLGNKFNNGVEQVINFKTVAQ